MFHYFRFNDLEKMSLEGWNIVTLKLLGLFFTSLSFCCNMIVIVVVTTSPLPASRANDTDTGTANLTWIFANKAISNNEVSLRNITKNLLQHTLANGERSIESIRRCLNNATDENISGINCRYFEKNIIDIDADSYKQYSTENIGLAVWMDVYSMATHAGSIQVEMCPFGFLLAAIVTLAAIIVATLISQLLQNLLGISCTPIQNRPFCSKVFDFSPLVFQSLSAMFTLIFILTVTGLSWSDSGRKQTKELLYRDDSILFTTLCIALMFNICSIVFIWFQLKQHRTHSTFYFKFGNISQERPLLIQNSVNKQYQSICEA